MFIHQMFMSLLIGCSNKLFFNSWPFDRTILLLFKLSHQQPEGSPAHCAIEEEKAVERLNAGRVQEGILKDNHEQGAQADVREENAVEHCGLAAEDFFQDVGKQGKVASFAEDK